MYQSKLVFISTNQKAWNVEKIAQECTFSFKKNQNDGNKVPIKLADLLLWSVRTKDSSNNTWTDERQKKKTFANYMQGWEQINIFNFYERSLNPLLTLSMTSVFTGGSNRKPELENEVIRELFAEPNTNANVPSSTHMLIHSWNPRIMESLFPVEKPLN